MAYTPGKIISFLSLLDEQIADNLETETLDFKECPTETKLRELTKEMAISLEVEFGGVSICNSNILSSLFRSLNCQGGQERDEQ